MKLDKIVQSLLVALLIIGVFASMAKNSYGFTFMGTASFGLAFLYMVQLIWRLIDDYAGLSKKNVAEIMELLLLAAMLLLFGFRAQYIYLTNGELIFAVVCGSLVLVYTSIAYGIYQSRRENNKLANVTFFFYASIPIFLLAVAFRTINAVWSSAFGAAGTLVSLPFLWSLVRNQEFEYAGKPISSFQFIASSKNKAGLLFIFFLSSALYTGLTSASVIPQIEYGDRPKDYIELIREAESGREKPVDGKYHHELYKEAMDRFLKRHADK